MTLEQIRKRLQDISDSEGKGSWFFEIGFDYDRAAQWWHLTTEQWDALPVAHQGRMLAMYRAMRTMSAWELYVNRPKPSRAKN